MASYADIYADRVWGFVLPDDHCVCKIYGSRSSAPTDVPDLSNLIATSEVADPPDAPGGPLTRFSFASDPALAALDHYWLVFQRTGALNPVAYYRVAYQTALGPHLDIRTGPDLLTNWAVDYGGFGGSLVIADTLIYDRAFTPEVSAFGAYAAAEYFAAEFIAPIGSTGLYLPPHTVDLG